MELAKVNDYLSASIQLERQVISEMQKLIKRDISKELMKGYMKLLTDNANKSK